MNDTLEYKINYYAVSKNGLYKKVIVSKIYKIYEKRV